MLYLPIYLFKLYGSIIIYVGLLNKLLLVKKKKIITYFKFDENVD